jgi:hypothetical protein
MSQESALETERERSKANQGGQSEEAIRGPYPVFVAYNGVEKKFDVNANQPVSVLLKHAVEQFNVVAQPHLLSLYNEAGVELPDSSKLGDVGVEAQDHLLMRPSAVKGG